MSCFQLLFIYNVSSMASHFNSDRPIFLIYILDQQKVSLNCVIPIFSILGVSLQSLLNPNYFHLSFSIIITVPCVTCAHLTSQGYRDVLCIVPWPHCPTRRRTAAKWCFWSPQSQGETQRFSFLSLIGNDVGSSQPPKCMEELKCRFKSLHLILLSLEIFKQQKPSCKTNFDKKEFD